MNVLKAAALVVCLATVAGILSAQPRVNQRNMYEGVMAIVPVIGTGTAADPKGPLDAPAPHTASPTSRKGILGFTYVLSDDGRLDLTETPDFSDTTVASSTTYTYFLQAQDFHHNRASVQSTVTTPAPGAIDSRQVGIRRPTLTGAVAANNLTCAPAAT